MPWKRPSERTEIVHIVVTSYRRKPYPSKHYVFVIDVTWNNSERFEIFRRYSDFFSFQTTLKALFPVAAGRRNEDRVIPALPKRIFVGRSHVARVAEARLEHINRYCQTLISLEPKISESAHVVGFFSPRIGDSQLPKLHLHRPASLHPQIIPAGSLFQEYCALAEYEAEDDSQISFSSGDKVLVASKDGSGWWMCECKGKVGWAPPSYLKKCCNGDDSDNSDSEEEYLGLPENYKDTDTDSKVTKDSDDSGLDSRSPSRTASTREGFNVPAIEAEEYKAIDSYEAQGPGQISFGDGDVIHVFDKIEDGWWFVSNGVDEGWAPCSYLESVKEGKEEDVLISSLDIEKYTTVDAYTAEEEDELSFPKGALVDVLQKSLDGWWLVKYNGKAGLTPATFLKKARDHQISGKEGARKISPPPQQNFQITKTYQQPPRKQSVRYRASIKKQKQAIEKGAGRSPLATSFATAYQSGVEKHKEISTLQIEDDDEYVPPAEFQKHKLQFPTITTPLSSDSEDAASSPPKSPRQIKRNIQNRIRRLENRLPSDSSLSEDSNPSTPTKPPIVRPKPQVKPKPTFLNLQKQQDKIQTTAQHAQRASGSEVLHARQIPLIKEQPPMEQLKPHTPHRPRGSEIRRAHEKFSLGSSDESVVSHQRSPSPSPSPSPRSKSPLRALWEESGEESDISIHSNRSNWLKPRRSASPDPRQQRMGRNQTSGDTTASSMGLQRAKSPSESEVFTLAPVVPTHREKSPSESEVFSLKPPQPAKSPVESVLPSPSPSPNPFNDQMADVLIKYILSSNDPNLISSLRDIVINNPKAVKALTE